MYDKRDGGHIENQDESCFACPRWWCRVELKTSFVLSVVDASVEELNRGIQPSPGPAPRTYRIERIEGKRNGGTEALGP